MRAWVGESRRIRDLAVLLPVVAAILFLPPAILLFAAPVSVAGIPLIVVHIFGAWAVLVLGAFFVARSLAKEEAAGQQDEAEGRADAAPPSGRD
jgi:hypothetical protein